MRHIKSIKKLVVLGCLLFTTLFLLNRLLISKAPEIMMMDQYKRLERDCVDLLCVGSSHAYTSCNTEVLWNRFGIPAFCISGPSQPVSNSYYYIKWALKTQKPKVVLLEASCMTTPYSDYEYGNVVNIAWMPQSLQRQVVLRETIDENNQKNLQWNIVYFHNHWKSLTNSDYQYLFHNKRPNTKGFNPWWDYNRYEDQITHWDPTKKAQPNPDSIKYVDQIISLCQDNGIQLVVYVSSHNLSEDTYQQLNWYKEYLSEQGIAFIDGVSLSEDLGIDPETDNCNSHIAYGGSVKLSNYIGEWLISNGYLVDRRGNEKYSLWESNAHYFENTREIYSLVNIEDADEYLKEVLHLDNAITVVVYNGRECEGFEDKITAIIEAENSNITAGVPWVCVIRDGQPMFQMSGEEIYYDAEMPDGRVLSITSEIGREASVLVDYNRLSDIGQKSLDVPAFRIYVYNNISGELAETRIINAETGEFSNK